MSVSHEQRLGRAQQDGHPSLDGRGDLDGDDLLGHPADESLALAGYGPLYQEGRLSIESADVIERLDLQNCLVGVQVSDDGRVWICVNGLSFLRFKPDQSLLVRPEPVTKL